MNASSPLLPSKHVRAYEAVLGCALAVWESVPRDGASLEVIEAAFRGRRRALGYSAGASDRQLLEKAIVLLYAMKRVDSTAEGGIKRCV